VDRVKDSFKWIFVKMRKPTFLMVVLLMIAALVEAFTVNSAFNLASLNNGDISQSHVLKLSLIQNAQVIILTAFLCYFISNAVNANLGIWGQFKAQFYAFFFSVFVSLILAMVAGSLIRFFLDDSNMEMQILGVTILFGLFMVMCYWHFYTMYLVRRKMQLMGIKHTTKMMLCDTFSIFKHWGSVAELSFSLLLITVLSIGCSSVISTAIESVYVSVITKTLFYPLSAVALVWFSKSLSDHYAKP
tara:strand:+ start:20876 stop:21610 length:735 start_codon:yes stop_codon:yes gene_type:complete